MSLSKPALLPTQQVVSAEMVTGFAGSVVLTCLLVAATTWAIVAGDWVSAAWATTVVALVAVGEAAVLTWAEAPGFVMALSAPLLALAAVVPFTIAAIPPDGNPGWFHLLQRYLGAMATGIVSVDDWPFTVGLCTGLWLCGYISGWFAIRERSGVGAAVACLMVLAINDFNAPNSGSLEVPQVVACVAAVLLIAQTSLRRSDIEWGRRQLRVSRRIPPRAAAAAAPLALGLVVVAALAPAATQGNLAGAILDWSGRGAYGGPASSGNGGGGGVQLPPAPVGYSALTTPGGALRPDPTPVLQYTTNTGQPTYLRAAVDTVEVNGNWSPAPIDNNTPFSTVRVSVKAGAQQPGAQTASAQQVQVQIRFGAAGPQPLLTPAYGGAVPVLFPGIPESIGINTQAVGLAPTPGGFGSAGAMQSVYLVQAAGSLGATFTSQATVPTATAAQLEAAGTTYPDWVAFEDTGGFGPDDQTIRAIADNWTSGAATPYDKATAIENHLRGDFTYTLNPPSPPSGVTPLEYFLTTSHAGYCQYFASAMGVMLRDEGVPARLVTGFGPGHTAVRNGVMVHTVTADDAHVWVEAYFPGYGWIPFEPTPSSDLGDYTPFPRGPAAQPSPGATPAPVPTAVPTPTPTPSPVPAVAPAPPSSGAPAAIIDTTEVLLLLLGIGGGLAFWVLRPVRLDILWRRVTTVGRLLGAGPVASDTFAGRAERIIEVLPSDRITLLHPRGGGPLGPRPVRAETARALRQLAGLIGQQAYSPTPLTLKQRRQCVYAWRAIARALPRLWYRSLLQRVAGTAGNTAVTRTSDSL